jgi:translocation and assembly module TamB
VLLARDTSGGQALTIDRESREKVPTTTKKILIGLCLLVLVLLTLSAGLFWRLAATTAGTQWLAGQAVRMAGDSLAWDELDGTLLDSLQLRGLRLRVPGAAVDIQALKLQWQPGSLVSGVVQVDLLAADGIRIVLSDTGEAKSPAEPFDPTRFDLPVGVIIEALELRDIELRAGDSAPRHIDTINLAARLQDQQLVLEKLEIFAPEGGLVASGNIALTEAMPLDLKAQGNWSLADQRQLAGDLEVEGELDNYRVASAGQLQVPGQAPTSWSLAARGTLEGMELEPLTVTSGPYQLALSGAVTWNGPITANLTYRATAEQLAELNPQLPARLDASGALLASFEAETLVLERLDLALEQAPLQLNVQGSALLPADAEPSLDVQLQWSSLQWPLTTQPAVSSPEGRLQLAGTPDAWNLELAMQVAGSQVPASDWLARGEGDLRELRLEYLQGKLLDGNVALAGTVGWDPVPRWNLQVVGNDLNPGSWQPDIPGLLAFELSTDGQIDAQQGPQLSFALQRLSGELSGRPLSAAGKGAVVGDALTLESLDLASGNNRLHGSGKVDGEQLALDWTLQVPQPGLLLPGAAGSLQASGRLAGTTASPRLSARLAGSGLQLDDLLLPRLSADVQVGLAAEAPLQLDLELESLQQGGQPLLDAARLNVIGTTASHQLTLALQGPSEQLQASLAGGLDVQQSAWLGSLSALNISSTAFGNWELAQAAPLALAPQRVALGETCLLASALKPGGQSDAEAARVCAEGEWSPAQGARLAARLQTFSLARLLPELNGQLNGELSGALAPDGELTARGGFDVSPGQMTVDTAQGRQQLVHGGGRLDLVVDPAGLNATLVFKPMQKGQMTAELLLPQLHRLPLADTQPVAGRIQVELPDLSGLQGWVPELEAVTGRIDGDLRLAGDLQQPRLEGELALGGGAADVPLAGLQLRDVQLQLRDDPAAPGYMLLSGGLTSGKGTLKLDGRLSLGGDMFALVVSGENVEVFDTADAQVLVSPDLDIGWDDQLLRLRGQVVVPRARITPKLALSPGLASQQASPDGAAQVGQEPDQIIARSPDVVVLNAQGEQLASAAPSLPFRLDSQVQLVLGDKVLVNALGLTGRLAGKVSFRNQPGQSAVVPIANGTLSVQDGSFRAFGQDLDIQTGQVIFRKVPVTEPEINLRAVRWIDNDPLVSAAGVQLTGPLAAPVMELFSQPELDPIEIQSYLLTGNPPSGGDSVLSIGTYLYPKVYVGYGYNLLEQTSEFNSLYTITPRYGIDSSVGEADNSVGVTITYER